MRSVRFGSPQEAASCFELTASFPGRPKIKAAAALAAGVAGGAAVLLQVHEAGRLPLWSYFAFAAALALIYLSAWTILTGLPPAWNLPRDAASPIVLFHPRVFFWESWKEANRKMPGGGGDPGYEVAAVALVTAFSLTLVEYFGDRLTLYRFWPGALEGRYGDLAAFAWWSLSRAISYTVIPALSILFVPALRWRNCGLDVRGLGAHLWIYEVLLAMVLPIIVFISFKEDFQGYYPFYEHCSRSWFDFLAWEALYWMQFVSLEFLFRGYMLHQLKRRLGAYSIFLMVVPYCMIHYGKPYLEPNAAIAAGVVLGTLSLRTGSIWCGCLIHVTVALSMDVAAMAQKGGLGELLRAGFF